MDFDGTLLTQEKVTSYPKGILLLNNDSYIYDIKGKYEAIISQENTQDITEK